MQSALPQGNGKHRCPEERRHTGTLLLLAPSRGSACHPPGIEFATRVAIWSGQTGLSALPLLRA